MNEKQNNKIYRIGDFAEYMGVTPDFLKHYQENGLLDVRVRANGYRYYSFDQSPRILECMRLRNYGVSVRDMRAMLVAEADEALEMLDEKAERMQRQAERINAVIDEHKRLHAWYRRRMQKHTDWEVRTVEPFYFLPHSDVDRFIDDKRIGALLKTWMHWLPIVKSAMRVAPSGSDTKPYATCWGLVLPESVAKRHGIAVNGVVERVPAQKAFIYHFLAAEPCFDMQCVAHGIHPMFEAMQRLGLKPAGAFHLVVEMRFIHPDGSGRGGCGRFIVGLEPSA